MTILQAAILGIVEGLTEFLPISSTGHLILTERLLGIPTTEFVKTFSVAIQSGAILAVLLLMGQRLIQDKKLLTHTIIAFIPTAVIGYMLHDYVRATLLGNATITAWALLLGGIVFIFFELTLGKRATNEPINTTKAVVIGTIQSLAVIPGVSRSGATILAGLALGNSRTEIVEFSFLLAIPTLLAATAADLVKVSDTITRDHTMLLAVGGAFSFISALLAIRWLLTFVKKNSFVSFGIYRMVIGLVFLLLF